MAAFDEIEKMILEENLSEENLTSPIWQVQTRIIGSDDLWIPMTPRNNYGVAQARAKYWGEIMPERDFRVKRIELNKLVGEEIIE